MPARARIPGILTPKSLWSYNPVPYGCALYLPLWSPGLNGSVFKSVDSFGHTCTVVGALRQSGGRLFDGVDDIITVSNHTSITDIFDGGGTIEAVINPSSDGESDSGHIVAKSRWVISTTAENPGVAVTIQLYYFFSGDDGRWDTGSVVPIGTTSVITVTYNSSHVDNNPIFYLNGSVIGNTENGTPTGTRASDTASDLTIGNRAATDRTFDGVEHELRAYNRILSADEVAYSSKMISWRYL